MAKIACKCLVCGHEWNVTPNHLLRGSGCPKCGGNYKRSTDEFVEDLMKANPNVELVGDYVDTQTKASFKCRRCGHEWTAKPIRLLRGDRGCPACGLERVKDKLRKSQEAFIEEMSDVNPDIVIIGKYINGREPIECRCARCGNHWEAAPSALLNGTGCPKCSHASTSYAEQFLLKYLETILDPDDVVSRNKNLISMELDIAIPAKKFAIEIGSWFWHQDKLDRDMSKWKLCSESGIRLLEIYDSYPEDLEAPQIPGCMVFHESLGEQKNRDLLKKIAMRIASMLELPSALPDAEWERISDEAYSNSRAKTTASYAEELEHINPTVELIGEYKGSHIKTLCRCRVCGYEWETKPAGLSLGKACPICGKKRAAEAQRRSQEDFVSLLSEINPGILVRGEYVNNHTRIECECRSCGHKWLGIPSSLIGGTGCPRCAGNMRKTHHEFVAEMKAAHPSIEVLGEYQNANTKVQCKCRICGKVWKGTPAQMLSARTGCPSCGQRTVARKLRKSPERFAEELSAVNPDVEPIGAYVNSSTKIECRCKVCGHVWSAVPGSLLRKHGCPMCAKIKRAARQTKSKDVFVSQLALVNPNIKPVGQYAGSSGKIECECVICGYRWAPLASNVLNGAGCPRCAGKERKTTDRFVAEMAEKNPSVEIVGEYVSSRARIECRCKTCSHTWQATPNNLLRGTGCPACARHRGRRTADN